MLYNIHYTYTHANACLYRAAHILNALSHTEKQHFKVFLSVLQYAKSIKQTERVLKYADLIDDMLDEWNTSTEDRRTVYLIFYDILTETGQVYVTNITLS